jgi:protein TonB
MPAPAARLRHAGLFVVSLALHGSLFLWLDREPSPLASVGEVSVSVEIVLGSQVAAGENSAPSPNEIQSVASPEPETPPQDQAAQVARNGTTEPVKAEQQPATPVQPPDKTEQPPEKLVEQQPEKAQQRPEKPVLTEQEPETTEQEPEKAEQQPVAKPQPAQAPPATASPVADTPREVAQAPAPKVETTVPLREPTPLPPPKPAQTEPPRAEQKPPVQRVERTPEPRRTTRRERPQGAARGENPTTRSAPASTPSVASSSIGVGRSDAHSNYKGAVSAHLARHKQYPAEARARGDQGTPAVSFAIDGSGRVASVRLARSSGVASLDREIEAMVRRASPFPAPPGGRGMSFTVPVSFHLR